MEWLKGLPKWAKWTLGLFALFVVIGALADGGEDNATDTSGGTQQESASGDDSPANRSEDAPDGAGDADGCGTTASDDCTPHVGSERSVRVDALVWQVQSAEATPSIGEQRYGLGETANGVYVIATLRVTSRKNESVTLSDDVISLVVDGGNTYKPDSDGTFAAMTDGAEPLLLTDIGPDSTLTAPVVFDVPRSVLGKELELSFGELGFGSTQGFIRLPQL